jgi:hypothetical protein
MPFGLSLGLSINRSISIYEDRRTRVELWGGGTRLHSALMRRLTSVHVFGLLMRLLSGTLNVWGWF